MSSTSCTHLESVDDAALPSAAGCEDCLRSGGQWVHLRMCSSCGHVGYCDSSPNTHATAHHHSSGHHLVRSYEPGEEWYWCYPDNVGFHRPGAPAAPSHP